MGNLINPESNDTVRKSEALIKARYRLNPLALKFITTIIANLKRSDEVDKEYIFRIKDFAEMMGVSYHDIYAEMEEAVEELLKKPLHIKTDTGWIKANWISDAEYKEGKGYISFTISKKLKPYLLAVKEKFLQYKLENILKLRSGYVIRLYEILKDWYNKENRYSNSKKIEKIVEVKWLREILEVPKSYLYGNSSGIKYRIIEKAKKELAEHTDIILDYEEIKTGRKVTHIKFIIKENPKNAKELEDEYYFLQSKQRFIAYIRKHYKNKTFRVIDYRQHGGGKVEYHIGEDGLVWMRDEHNLEKLPAEHIDEFFENSLKHAKENTQYAELLYKKQEIS